MHKKLPIVTAMNNDSIVKRSVLDIVFGLIALFFLFIPVTLLVKVIVGLLAVSTPILNLIASIEKGLLWNALCRLWRDFFQPIFRIQMLTIGLLGLVPVETIAVWGLPLYLSILPFIILVMKRSFITVLAVIFNHTPNNDH